MTRRAVPAGAVSRHNAVRIWKWMALTFGYMFALAYRARFAEYNIAVALGAG